MILFIISFLMVFLSSYLITSLLVKKNDAAGFFYIPLLAFAEIVLDFELLSLFNAISTAGVLILNAVTLAAAFALWYFKAGEFWSFSLKHFVKKFAGAVCKDKYLLTLAIGFGVFFLVSLFLVIISPVVNDDADSYHVARSAFWIVNKNLNHFAVGDIRNLVFPINSEILYAWVILFTRKLLFTGAFSFVGYLLSVFGIYNILDLIKFDIRKKLWVVFIVSSFSSVVVLSSGTETDLIISGLVLSSVYLFWRGVKDGCKIPVFMAALAYVLAVGVKTTALFAIPGVGIAFCGLAYYYRKKEFYKPVLSFLGFGVINFILFALYNYLLNLIEFGDISGPANFVMLHKNIYGLKAVPAHIIKYLFLFIDFTGFRWSDYVGDNILHLRDGILSALNLAGIQDGIFTSKDKVVNRSLLEPLVGMGVVGLLTFLPALILSFVKPFRNKNKKTAAVLGFGILFVINLVTISAVLIYMAYNIRFLTSLCVISAPVLIYTYSRKNNIYKFIVTFFAMFSLVLVSTHIWARPFFRITNYMKHGISITKIRQCMTQSILLAKFPSKNFDFEKYPVTSMPELLKNYISKFDKSNKVIYFSSCGKGLLPVVMLNLDGYHIDFELIENMDKIDLSRYNIIITLNDIQESFLIKNQNPAYCSYDALKIENKDILMKSTCTLSPEFYNAKGFVLIDEFNKKIYNERLIGQKINVEIDDDTDYYKIYENRNNPIIK